MVFEWDSKKAASNAKKHGVAFEDAASAFDDAKATIFDDPDHSLVEKRELLLGRSRLNSILVVAFTVRGQNIRIISARRANRKERAVYETRAKG